MFIELLALYRAASTRSSPDQYSCVACTRLVNDNVIVRREIGIRL